MVAQPFFLVVPCFLPNQLRFDTFPGKSREVEITF